MSTYHITLIAFGSISILAFAVGLMLRELLGSGKVVTEGAGGERRISLRRPRTVFDQAPATTTLGRIDQSFDRLVLETDTGISPPAAFLLICCFALTLGGGTWVATLDVLSGVGAGLVGMVLPLLVMSFQRSRRMKEIRSEMPHVLDMLARACRAGQNSEQALSLLGDELDGRLGREFRQCSHQLELGRSFTETLKSLAARVRTMEMRILTTALIVQRQTGGNLAETLERMSGVIRDRLSAHRQMLAATGAGRASTLLIATISPMAYLFMYTFQRPHLAILYEDPLGKVLLMVAGVLEVIGLIWVFALLRQND